MKLFKLLFVAIIAFGMVACNNEDVPQIIDGPEATVSVKVFPSSKSPATRLAGDLTEESLGKGLAAESAIKNVEVWLFVGETPDGYGEGSDGDAFVEDVVTTAGPKTMVVAANANIGEVANKAELLAKFAETLSQDLTNGLVMTSVPVDIELIGGKNQYGYKTTDTDAALSLYDADAKQISAGVRLPITRINARIALVGLEYNFTSPFYDEFRLTEVALFNAREASNYFGTPLYKGNDFLYGSAYPSTLSTYVGSVGYAGTTYTAAVDPNLAQAYYNPVQDPALVAPTLVNAKNAHYFYAFENSANTETDKVGTFIVLKGTLWNDGVQYKALGLETDADGYTYYAIWVNAVNDMYTYDEEYAPDGTIKRNTQYNISVNLKKAGNPTIDPPVEAQLDVWVEVAPWIVVGQDVEW
jgi:hypothetical protein